MSTASIYGWWFAAASAEVQLRDNLKIVRPGSGYTLGLRGLAHPPATNDDGIKQPGEARRTAHGKVVNTQVIGPSCAPIVHEARRDGLRWGDAAA